VLDRISSNIKFSSKILSGGHTLDTTVSSGISIITELIWSKHLVVLKVFSSTHSLKDPISQLGKDCSGRKHLASKNLWNTRNSPMHNVVDWIKSRIDDLLYGGHLRSTEQTSTSVSKFNSISQVFSCTVRSPHWRSPWFKSSVHISGRKSTNPSSWISAKSSILS